MSPTKFLIRARIRAELTDEPVCKNQVTASDTTSGSLEELRFLSSQANHSQKVSSAAERWRALCILCVALVLSMTSWFSATAITPELRHTWKLSEPFVVWLTNDVQIGFVMGALALSLVNLPDLIRPN